jgi:threonine/homoserine/homoserine lactone efflux protein
LFVPIVLLKGFVLGFIFAVTMVPGTVWCVQVTRRFGLGGGLRAALGIILGQSVWIAAAVALMGVLWMLPLQDKLTLVFRSLAGVVFLYMSYVHFRVRKADTLTCPELPEDGKRLFRGTLAVSLGMPMRFFGYLAFCVAAGFNTHSPGLHMWLLIVASAVVGTAAWWFYMVGLATVFGNKVPERISLHSINKLNPLSGVILLLIFAMTLMPLAVRH